MPVGKELYKSVKDEGAWRKPTRRGRRPLSKTKVTEIEQEWESSRPRLPPPPPIEKCPVQKCPVDVTESKSKLSRGSIHDTED